MWPFDSNKHSTYQQYAQAYDTGNFNILNPAEALNHLQQFIQGAPPEMQQNIYQQHFNQMPYEHRMLLAQQIPPQYGVDPNDPWSMSQGFLRMGQEQPNLLQRIFSHPVLLGSSLALTGLIAKHMLNHHQQEQSEGRQQYDNQTYGNAQFGNANQAYGNQQYGTPQYGNNQGGYQGEQNIRQELNEERREERELRQELRQEEQELERLEEGQQRRHHHRNENY